MLILSGNAVAETYVVLRLEDFPDTRRLPKQLMDALTALWKQVDITPEQNALFAVRIERTTFPALKSRPLPGETPSASEPARPVS